ncbi:MAG: hypothetical protein SVR08_10350, partial [Spirochaetota bacterium]|nr:hypothetical protein [Spirochaetota bacterium]
MNRITILTAIFLITILRQDQGIIKTHSYARGISHLALQQKEKKKAGSSHADDIAKYERDILKSFSNGNYFKLYDNIEKFVLRFPENPISLLYVYDLTRLSDIYGFERTVKTLKQIITKIEKKTDFKHRNNTLLLLKLELEKLLYRFRIKDAENLSKKLAPLRKWTLAGPYFKYGASDLYYPFMPEIITRLDIPNLNKKKILLKNRTGRLNLKKYLYPAKGVAYAFTTFKQIKPVKIRIYSDSSYILYINGEKTVENAKGKTFRQVRILRVWGTDEITIMLKLINEDKWDFRVLVTDDDDNILNVSCEPEKLIFTDFKYIEEMEHPFTSIMDKTAKDPADSYLQLGSFFYELNSIEAVEFYKKSLAIKRDILKQFLLASAMIEMCDDINSSFYMEGWQMLMNLASSNPNFIPVQYKYFQKLIQRRSILQAFYKGKELIKKAKYHLQLRLDYIDLLKSLGYDKELIEEIHSLRKDFPCSTAPLIKLAEYYRDKNILKSTSIYRKVIEIDPSQRTIKRLLGIYKEQGRYADAARLINDYDHDSNFNDDLIETYINSGNFESAKNIIFKEMINKDDPYYHLKLGLISFMHDI